MSSARQIAAAVGLALPAMLMGFAAGGTIAAALSDSGSGLSDAATTAFWALATGVASALVVLAWGLRRREPFPWSWVFAGWVSAAIAVIALIQLTPKQPPPEPTPATDRPTTAVAVVATPVAPDTSRADSVIALAPPGRATDSLWLTRTVAVRTAPHPDAEHIASVAAVAELGHRELGYEEVAILVRGSTPGWLRVALRDGRRGWIAVDAGQPVIPLDSILPMSLAYLTPAWDRRIRASPERAVEAVRVAGIDPGEDEVPVEIIGSLRNADGLWWQVRVLEYSPCEGINTPPTATEGWIPAWRDARLTAEWYSRGC